MSRGRQRRADLGLERRPQPPEHLLERDVAQRRRRRLRVPAAAQVPEDPPDVDLGQPAAAHDVRAVGHLR